MNDRVIKYFNAVAEKLSAEHSISSTIKNPSDIGYARENLLKGFLNNHIPGRLSATLGGHIFGFNQEESKQLDIMILNDIGLNFKENDKPFAPIENVAAVVSVKSQLDSANLIDTLNNISSIPQIDKDAIDFLGMSGNPFGYFIEHYPRFVVFAYEGMSLETTLETINNFYAQNDIAINRRPHSIIVNKKFYIEYSNSATQTYNGSIIPASTFHGINLDSDLLGLPLFQILGPLNGYTSWLSKMGISYTKYFISSLEKLKFKTE